MIKASVDISLKGTEKLRSALRAGNPLVTKLLKRWAALYREFAQRRFDDHARGGGSDGAWAALKPSTLAARARKGAKVSKATKDKLERVRQSRQAAGVKTVAAGGVAILTDTGLMRRGLDPELNTSAGGMEDIEDAGLGFAVQVGYGGPAAHSGGGPSIADLVVFHDQGSGRLPKRPIIVAPAESVRAEMAREAQKTLNELAGAKS